MCCFSSHRLVGLFVGVCAWAVLWPSVGGATDPVERLRKALKVDVGTTIPIFPNLEYRKSEAKSAIDEMKTLAQLRRAYFLQEWKSLAPVIPSDKKFLQRMLEFDDEIRSERNRIAVKLTDAIKRSAQGASSDKQIAVAMLIAELADGEQPTERMPAGKFASRFTEVVLGLLKHDDVLVRQAGLNALGKITPAPADVFGTPKTGEPLKSALQSPELGPRRLAAYALSDLVKNAHYRGEAAKNDKVNRADEMETLAQAIGLALFGLRAAEKDDHVRGYCLQAIAESGKALVEYGSPADTAIQFQLEGKTLAPRDDLKKILLAYQQANPALIVAVNDGNVKIQLAALQALDQIAHLRGKVVGGAPPEQPIGLGKYDPLDAVIKGDWIKVAALLERTASQDDLPLRRGAIDFLEAVSVEVEQTLESQKKTAPARRRLFVEKISLALGDPDRFVRWSAIRALRKVSPAVVDRDVILALGAMLVDAKETDADLTQASALALEDLADSDSAGLAVPYLRSLVVDGQKDVESRFAAMDALAALGATEKHEAAANGAFPAVISILTDEDVRIRRKAAETLGLLGRPATRALADEAIAALRAALRDEDAEVRLNASEAILNIVIPAR